MHACGWIHRNIRSRNLLLFLPDAGRLSTEKTRATPYLVGFKYARPEADVSKSQHDRDLSMNLYHHPNRQNNTTESFTKEHDIYAVGVVLLEIGMWRTITDRFLKPIPWEKTLTEWQIQKALVSLAKNELEIQMGRKYMEAVLACLNTDFDVHDDDEPNSKLAFAFREKVLDQIEPDIGL